MSKETLKPCPFCGGEARCYSDPDEMEDSEGRIWAYYISCDRCAATSGWYFSRDHAAVAWNRRVTDGNIHTESQNARQL